MTLEELTKEYIGDKLAGYDLSIYSYEEVGIDPKTGLLNEIVETKSLHISLRIVRYDGEINALIYDAACQDWKYVRSFVKEDKSIEQLLQSVPEQPLTDKESCERLWPHISKAITCLS